MHKSTGTGSSIQSLARRIKAVDVPEVAEDALDSLFTERERAQVTLDSIGDAVVSTDFRGNVVYLNQAAERLTGNVQDVVAGLPVAEVIRLIDADSHTAIDNPAAASIIENEKRFALENCLMVRRDGSLVPVEVSSTPIHDRLGGVVGAVLVARDMTATRALSDKLSRLALYDHLTGLPNRTLFADRVDQAISLSIRTGKPFSVLYIDLDKFKDVNDSLGHEAGDQLLQAAAERLRACVRQSDTVSRYGGDEFLALLVDCAHDDSGIPCASKIVEALSVPYDLCDRQISLSASVGIAVFPGDAADRPALVRAADAAMYQAKCSGRNNCRRYSGDALGRPASEAPDSAALIDPTRT